MNHKNITVCHNSSQPHLNKKSKQVIFIVSFLGMRGEKKANTGEVHVTLPLVKFILSMWILSQSIFNAHQVFVFLYHDPNMGFVSIH